MCVELSNVAVPALDALAGPDMDDTSGFAPVSPENKEHGAGRANTRDSWPSAFQKIGDEARQKRWNVEDHSFLPTTTTAPRVGS